MTPCSGALAITSSEEVSPADQATATFLPVNNGETLSIELSDGAHFDSVLADSKTLNVDRPQTIGYTTFGWWDSWGKCAAGTAGGAGTGALGGAGVGSAVPVIGTTIGGVIGGVSGALTGAAAAC